MIASFLSLPLDPSLAATSSQIDIEQQFAQQVGSIDDKAFQKAVWWRNLNRVMSGVGTLLVATIVSLYQALRVDVILMCSRLYWPFLCQERQLERQYHRTSANHINSQLPKLSPKRLPICHSHNGAIINHICSILDAIYVLIMDPLTM